MRVCSKIGRCFSLKHDLIEKNKILQKKVGDLSVEVEQLEGLRSENKRLRSLLRFKKRVRFETVCAEVLARDPNGWLGSFVIDKGSVDGLRKGTAVCSANGLLGKVVDPGENTSSVMLITHPAFKTGGTIKGKGVGGIVAGTGAGMAKMRYIPVAAEIAEGDIVTTSGLSRIFPKGIIIGRVVSVSKSKTGLYKNAVIRPSADTFAQEEVLCIKW